MAEVSLFFDSILRDGIEDREYKSEDWARYFRTFLTDGIKNGGTNLKVSPLESGLKVQIAPGVCLIKGRMGAIVDEPSVLDLLPADPVNPRIDRVVARLTLHENTGRKIEYAVKTGAPSSSPVAQILEREVAIWELALADIWVGRGATKLYDYDVTDLRLNQNLCGLINSLIQADTQGVFDEFYAYFSQKRSEYDAELDGIVSEWEAWYSQIRTEIYNLLYFSFDNWVYQAGNTLVTTFPTSDQILETIKNTVSGNVFATRDTVFLENGDIEETITCTEYEINVKKTTTFNADGSISELVAEVA